MEKYTLFFSTGIGDEEKSLEFDAHSTAAALDTAKQEARGTRARLTLGGKPVCKMRLIEETGVWFIEPASDDASEYKPAEQRPDQIA